MEAAVVAAVEVVAEVANRLLLFMYASFGGNESILVSVIKIYVIKLFDNDMQHLIFEDYEMPV